MLTRSELWQIYGKLSKVRISGEQGTLQSSVDIMSDEEVARISECIVTIYAVIDLNEKLDNKMDQ